MQPPLAKIITEVEEVTNKAMTYTRTLMSQLSPPALSESGLPMALHWLAEQMQQHNLFVSLQIKTEIPTIPEGQALLLFQSSRELLFNCVKHAKTHEATITLEQVDGSLCIQISDQGAGFDLADASKKAHSPTSGFGLSSIRERLLSLGGRFELESSPGNGTTATLVLPLSDTLSNRSSRALTDRSLKRPRGQVKHKTTVQE
jgi:signal transduction histidine kinase